MFTVTSRLNRMQSAVDTDLLNNIGNVWSVSLINLYIGF